MLAAVAIVFDRPFDVGDSDRRSTRSSGTVEHIGLKTTRLRSVTGEQIVIGNGDLLKSKLRTITRMQERRVLFNLDVPYDTPPRSSSGFRRSLEEIVSGSSRCGFERSHFSGFQESALRIETVYFVLDPDYRKFMDIQQGVNLEVLRRFATPRDRVRLPDADRATPGAATGSQRRRPGSSGGCPWPPRLRRDVKRALHRSPTSQPLTSSRESTHRRRRSTAP